MDDKLKKAKKLFYNKQYNEAKELFCKLNLTYEAGLSCFLMKDIIGAKNFFSKKVNLCPASDFGITIINIVENKNIQKLGYFQVRSFLEVFINLLIENEIYDWAQKIIDRYNIFTQANPETPKFIARVLHANGYDKAVHPFAKLAKEICPKDAEIYYIEACVYIKENNSDEAKKCIDTCLSFAPDYFPILKLNKTMEKIV